MRFFVLLFTTILQAQSPLTLADAVRMAIDQHPLLQAGKARVATAEGARLQGSLRPNPRLILQSENTRFWGPPGFSYPNDTDNFGYLSQVFETGGKRQRRIEYAGTLVSRAELDREVIALQVAGKVAAAYWAAVAALELRDLLRQDLQRFEEIVTYHRNRVQQGAAAELELMRVLLEKDRLTITARGSEQDATRALLALSREMGYEKPVIAVLSGKLASPVEVDAPDFAKAIATRPEVRLARELLVISTANQRLQEANAKPDPEVLFGYKRTAGLNTLLGGVQINLPFRNRNQGAIAAALAESRVSEYGVRAVERQVRHEAESAYAEVQSRRRLLLETFVPMRTRVDEVVRISQAAYREGGTDLLRVLDAERLRLETHMAYHKALGEYQQSLTALQLALGEMP